MTKLQMAMFPPKSDWVPPIELPDIFDADEIAIDVETRDPNLKQKGTGLANERRRGGGLCDSRGRLEMLHPRGPCRRRQPRQAYRQ